MSLTQLIEISREYGADERYVLAGGGNTSWKAGGFMYVKASGTSLKGIDENGFVKMDLDGLARIWEAEYPENSADREAAALKDLMDSRAPGQENRPSVETLLHALFPQAFVVHTHPAQVNGLTCGRDGEALAGELFGDDSLWVPLVNPGYILAREVRSRIQARVAQGKPFPPIVFLQNHGVFVAREDLAGVRETYRRIMSTLEERITRQPDFQEPADAALTARGNDLCRIVSAGIAAASKGAEAAETAHPARPAGQPPTEAPCCLFAVNSELLRLLASRDSFEPVSSAYTPDHIVYAGAAPLYLDSIPRDAGDITAAVGSGPVPKIIAVQGLGIYACGSSRKAAATSLSLFLDAVKVSVYAASFGGHRFMTPEHVDFIVNWEVERYRARQLKGDTG